MMGTADLTKINNGVFNLRKECALNYMSLALATCQTFEIKYEKYDYSVFVTITFSSRY